jgi:hypothetical protein
MKKILTIISILVFLAIWGKDIQVCKGQFEGDPQATCVNIWK